MSQSLPRITEQIIRDRVGSQSFARGQRYFKSSHHERQFADTDENASRPGRRDSYSVLRIA